MFLLGEIVFNVAPTGVVIRFGDFPSLDTFQTECMATVRRQSNSPHHTRPFAALVRKVNNIQNICGNNDMTPDGKLDMIRNLLDDKAL